MTGLLREEARVDILDFSENFLISHTDDEETLLSPKDSFLSPLLIVAYDITPEQISVLYAKVKPQLVLKDIQNIYFFNF